MTTFFDMFKFPSLDPDVLRKSGETWVKGLQDIQAAKTASLQERAGEVSNFWTAFFSVKTMDDVKKLQDEVRQSIEKTVADNHKTMGSFTTLVEETMKPLKPGDGSHS